MNLPNDPNAPEIPQDAKGNPVYEQTREDMPLWCCGRNCGRNSRIAILIMTTIGIICSTWCIFSAKYFRFEALRNDTFFDEAKAQPEPFEHATEAYVGLFRYEILDVFEYPWPPNKQPPGPELGGPDVEGAAIDGALGNRFLQGGELPTDSPSTAADGALDGALGTTQPTTAEIIIVLPGGPTDGDASATPTIVPVNIGIDNSTSPTLSPSPSMLPSAAPSEKTSEPTSSPSFSPTLPPSGQPTISDPNLDIDDELDVVKKYPNGMKQFPDDGPFNKAQLGGMLAPIFAAAGIFFLLIEFCFCHYRCSWLPTAILLYLAFTFQTFTLFLFLSENWCKYEQDCNLGFAGYLSVIAVLMYMISQTLMCCTPRPPPCFNCCKKPPVRRKKKKKKKRNPGSQSDLDPSEYGSQSDLDPSESGYGDDESDYSGFQDEPNAARGAPPRQAPYSNPQDAPEGYVNPYDRSQADDADQSYYDDPSQSTEYNDDGTYSGADNTYGDDTSYYDDQTYGNDDDQTYGDGTYNEGGHDDGTYADQSQSQYDDDTYGGSKNRFT